MSKFLIDGIWMDAATGKPVVEAKAKGGEQGDLQAKLDAAIKERNNLKAKLDSIKALPGNALELLEGVQGISKALAQKALDALTTSQPSDGE